MPSTSRHDGASASKKHRASRGGSAADGSAQSPIEASAQSLFFGSPLLYRAKRFLIEEVVWRCILCGIFRLSPNPFPDISHAFAGKRLLVAACGPGNVSTGPPIQGASDVTAFDISPEFVAACRTNRPQWKVSVGDIRNIPFEDRTFDVAILYSSLHHIPADARRVLGELARVTDGCIVIVEGVLPERGLLRRALLLWYALVDGGVHYYSRQELQRVFDELSLQVETQGQYGPIRHMLLAVLKTPARPGPDLTNAPRDAGSRGTLSGNDSPYMIRESRE